MDEKRHIESRMRVALALFAALLLLPLLQEWTGIFPQRPLAGVEESAPKVAFSKSNWLDGSFQESFELRHYQWMGMRSSMVRLQNQLDYSLFGKLFKAIVQSDKGELFRRSSVDAFTGRDFVGRKQIEYHANHIAYLQQFLLLRDIRLLPVITPTKLRCMPDQLPNHDLQVVGETNYAVYREELTRLGVGFLDLTEVLKAAVRENEHRVFPKTGTHWTDYGAIIGFQEILDRIEPGAGGESRGFEIMDYETIGEMRGTDSDAGDLLNLMFDPPVAAIDYPFLDFHKRPPLQRPKVLVISDSFWWKIYDQGLHGNSFAPGSQFRYYNWEVYSEDWEGAKLVSDFDLWKSVEEVDWVILCTNEANLHKFPFGFPDQLLESQGLFKP